ncbi:MAG: hypothetical protein J5674_00445, partial [Candidatus Methanomethylophilaceae archaeon]|nr:hypothetical protein [Candidatus Methanomethylophilaceae archaeon]
DLVDLNEFVLINVGEGLDSSSVTASCGGRTVSVEYGAPLVDQLREAGFRGLVVLEEKNVYGRSTSYEVFVASEDDVSLEVEISGQRKVVDGDCELTGWLPRFISASSAVGTAAFKVYPEYFVQEAELLLPTELPALELRPGTYIVKAISGSGISWTMKLEVEDVRPVYSWSADNRMVSIAFESEYISVQPTVESLGATCTKGGMARYTVSGTFMGIDYEDSRTVSVPPLGHDYLLDYEWSSDGSSVKVSFTCLHDGEHSGDFTISGSQITKSKVQGGDLCTVDVVYNGVYVSSRHLVQDVSPAGEGFEGEGPEADQPEAPGEPSGFWSVLDGLAGFFGSAVDAISGFFGSIVDGVSGLFGSAVDAISGFFGSIVDGVSGLFEKIVEGVGSMLGICDWRRVTE